MKMYVTDIIDQLRQARCSEPLLARGDDDIAQTDVVVTQTLPADTIKGQGIMHQGQ